MPVRAIALERRNCFSGGPVVRHDQRILVILDHPKPLRRRAIAKIEGIALAPTLCTEAEQLRDLIFVERFLAFRPIELVKEPREGGRLERRFAMVAQCRLSRRDRLRDVPPRASSFGPEDDKAPFVEAPVAIAAARRLSERIKAGHRPK